MNKDQGVLIDYRGFVSSDLKMLLDDLSAGRLDLGDQVFNNLPDSSVVLVIDEEYFYGSGLMKYFTNYCRP